MISHLCRPSEAPKGDLKTDVIHSDSGGLVALTCRPFGGNMHERFVLMDCLVFAKRKIING